MNRPGIDVRHRTALVACVLALAMGGCAAAPLGVAGATQDLTANEAGQAGSQGETDGTATEEAAGDTGGAADAQAGTQRDVSGGDAKEEGEEKPEDTGDSEKADEEAPVSAADIAAYLQGEKFKLAGVSLALDREQAQLVEVRVVDGQVWVLDASATDSKKAEKAEGDLVKALAKDYDEDGDHGWIRPLSAKSFEEHLRQAFKDKLMEVRACVLARALAYCELEDGEAVAPTDEELKDARRFDLPATPFNAAVHWVVLPQKAVGEPAGESAAASTGTKAEAVDGTGLQTENPSSRQTAASGGASAGAANMQSGATGAGFSADQTQAANVGSIEVQQTGSTATQGTDEKVWVVDKAAWDEKVLVNQAWDEQVWVPKQEWVTNNVWVVDTPAWEESRLVHEGYYETRQTEIYYRFAADGYVTYDDADLVAHIKELIAQDMVTNYETLWDHEQVWIEPEYEKVTHPEEGHWEDQGSYADNGHYETVHHDAEYTTVHHSEEGHWE